ncbi:hypothetical protein [Mechercharimyces sp. CAU 1602]|nr:hypothetical protein [Mechercharimyces sp. CAU 1602]MCS1350385.1 hypothetical protein [Mechercharimyces sp. CAU 1602]
MKHTATVLSILLAVFGMIAVTPAQSGPSDEVCDITICDPVDFIK